MVNYVREEAFLAWYDGVIANKTYNPQLVLGEVFESFCKTGKSIFEVPSKKTISGNAESYPFRAENLGCCGASTIMIYF